MTEPTLTGRYLLLPRPSIDYKVPLLPLLTPWLEGSAIHEVPEYALPTLACAFSLARSAGSLWGSELHLEDVVPTLTPKGCWRISIINKNHIY